MASDIKMIDEAGILTYCADHPEAVAGVQYHRAPARTARWEAEKRIPALLKAFDPATLADEIGRRVTGNRPPQPQRNRKIDGSAALAGWYVGKLFDMADDSTAPATARTTAVQRIRQLMAACLAALHPPLRQNLAEVKRTKGQSLPPFAAALMKDRA